MSIRAHLLTETTRWEKERLFSRKPSDEYRSDGIRNTSFDKDRSNNWFWQESSMDIKTSGQKFAEESEHSPGLKGSPSRCSLRAAERPGSRPSRPMTTVLSPGEGQIGLRCLLTQSQRTQHGPANSAARPEGGPTKSHLQTDHTASVPKDHAGPPQVKDTEPSGQCQIWAFLWHQGCFWWNLNEICRSDNNIVLTFVSWFW